MNITAIFNHAYLTIRTEIHRFCSAAWRLNPELYESFAKDGTEEERLQLGTLLTSYSQLPVPPSKPYRQFIRDLINAALGKLESFSKKLYEGAHTIGDPSAIEFRAELLNAFRTRRGHINGPPIFVTRPI